MSFNVKLVTANDSNLREMRYVSNLLIKLSGKDIDLNEEIDDEPGLYINDVKKSSIAELTELFNIASLKNEFLSAKDMHGRAIESNINDESIPQINLYAEKIFGPLEQKKFQILFTHDVDWVTGLNAVSVAKSLRNIISKNGDPWLSLFQILDTNVFYKGIEKIIEMEERYGIKSWFFFLSGPYGSGKYQSRYSSKLKIFKKIVTLVKEHNCEIGLHGSYDASGKNSYKAEAQMLRDETGCEIKSHRNHYLRFDPETLCNSLEEADIKCDMSIGYNSLTGFRGGIANDYNLFNHIANRASDIVEIPLLFMERSNHIENPDKALNKFSKLLGQVKKYNGCASVLFHPESFVTDKRWYSFYEDFIKMCEESGADISGNYKL